MPAFARRSTAVLTEGLLLAAIVALLAAVVGLIAPAAARPPAEYVVGEVVVQYRPTVDSARRAAIESGSGARFKGTIDALGVHVLSVKPGQEDAVARRLAANPNVQFAERSTISRATDTSTDDPYLSSQLKTSLTQVKAATGWDISTGQNGFVVAVVDSGVSSHPDLAGKLVPGYDFVNGDADPTDDNGHGTHVTGIIAAATNNAVGVAGLCWGCKVMPVKVLGADGVGSNSNVAAGIVYAADHGARVINLSLGGTSSSTTVKSAVDYAVAKGALVVAAVGNQGCACVLYPAKYPNVIAVGAVDGSNVLRSWSNTGPEVDLVAPGSNWTTSTKMSSGYAAFSGTSSATPVVSALAALVWSTAPTLSPSQMEARLESTAVGLGDPSQYGAGLVDFAAALGAPGAPATSPTPAPTPPATASPTTAPTPAPIASPTPSPTPSPTATPSAAPTMTPAPSGPVTLVTKTYKGMLNARQTTKDFALSMGSGPMTATLTGSGSLSLILMRSDGSTVTTAQGSTGQVVATLDAGTYVLRVSGDGSKASFKLTVTYTTP